MTSRKFKINSNIAESVVQTLNETFKICCKAALKGNSIIRYYSAQVSSVFIQFSSISVNVVKFFIYESNLIQL